MYVPVVVVRSPDVVLLPDDVLAPPPVSPLLTLTRHPCPVSNPSATTADPTDHVKVLFMAKLS
jgi:hypothetical protein